VQEKYMFLKLVFQTELLKHYIITLYKQNQLFCGL
jgi:hypothetical protein